jgi:hypothetical protein
MLRGDDGWSRPPGGLEEALASVRKLDFLNVFLLFTEDIRRISSCPLLAVVPPLIYACISAISACCAAVYLEKDSTVTRPLAGVSEFDIMIAVARGLGA